MSTRWIHRLFLFIPAANRENANAGHTLYWPEGDGERLTFSVPLSPDGFAPPTHYGTNTAATAHLYATWLDLLATVAPGATWYLLDRDGGFLLDTNGGAPVNQGFSWPAALDDMGLETIQPTEET